MYNLFIFDLLITDSLFPEFVLKEEGFDNSPNADINEANKSFLKNKKAVKREIKKSLSDFLRECKKRKD